MRFIVALLATVVLILLLLMLFKCGLWLKNRLKANTSSTNTIATGSTSSESVGLTTRSLRILSLDVFRGLVKTPFFSVKHEYAKKIFI